MKSDLNLLRVELSEHHQTTYHDGAAANVLNIPPKCPHNPVNPLLLCGEAARVGESPRRVRHCTPPPR